MRRQFLCMPLLLDSRLATANQSRVVMATNINASNFKWGSIVVIVLIVVGYAIYSGSRISVVDLPGNLRIEFEEQIAGPSVVGNAVDSLTSAGRDQGDNYIQPPGRARIALGSIEEVLLVSGIDDPINRHSDLIVSVLESRDVTRTFQDGDRDGTFIVWITNQESPNCLNYSTLLQRHNETKQLAFREACKHDNEWRSQISPELRELAGVTESDDLTSLTNTGTAQVKSLGRVISCLEENEQSIILGLFTPGALVNLCFVDGELPAESIDVAAAGNVTLPQKLSLTMDAAYSMAEWGYALYQRDEFVGSTLFFEAMIILHHEDRYFQNMAGSSKMGAKNFSGALPYFDRAIRLDPQYVHALLNRAECLIRLNRPDQARSDLHKVIEYDKEDGQPSAQRARWMLEEYY